MEKFPVSAGLQHTREETEDVSGTSNVFAQYQVCMEIGIFYTKNFFSVVKGSWFGKRKEELCLLQSSLIHLINSQKVLYFFVKIIHVYILMFNRH